MNDEITNIPKVRFKGYTEDWEQRKSSDLMSFSNGINAPKENYGKGRKMISVMDILDEQPIKYESIRNSVEVDKKVELKNKVEHGDLVFVRSSEVSEEVGWAKAYLEEEYALYSGFSIRGKRIKEFNPHFVELSLNSVNRKQIERKAGGSTRFNVSQNVMNSLEILMPKFEEQNKIGRFFKQLDDTIALHQRELDLLRKTKQTYLQKMFPKTGEDRPEIRFAGFTEPWEQRTLEKMIEEFSVKSKTENEHRVLSSTNSGMEIREGRVSGTSNLGYKIIEDGDLVLSPQNLWLGNININDIGTGLVSPSYKTFKIKNVDSSFLKPQLHTSKMLAEYKNSSTQGASIVRRNLELDSFYQILIRVPNATEQSKIGDFFTKLDDTITLHQHNLNVLKEMKKSLLQQMFV